MSGLAPGLYEEIPVEAYHEDPAERPSLSSSIAHLLCSQSPKHAWTAHPRLNPNFERKTAEHLDVGTAAHAYLLEGEASVEIVQANDWRTNAAKEARDAARAIGRQPLLAKDWQAVQDMVDAARKQLALHSANPEPFTDGTPEQTLIWEEPGGVLCRARLDWLHGDYSAVDDYKTTSRSANPETWSRTIFGVGFDLQAAFYLRGLKKLTGRELDYRLVVQEVSEPYALSVISLTPAALMLAEKKVDYALSLWRDCMKRGHWPGYTTRVAYAELPPWEEARWLEQELRDEEVAA